MIVANRGASEVLAIGRVRPSRYHWAPDREEYRHAIDVRWFTNFAKSVPQQGAWQTTTVYPVPPELFRMIIGQSDQPAAGLAQAIRARGLFFPDEVIANYVLALLTKRFAILTGISGTGKTQLAKAVAESFPIVRRIVAPIEVPEDAFVIEVGLNMLKRGQIWLPVAMLPGLDLPSPDTGKKGTGSVAVRLPEGHHTVRMWREESGRTTLYFSGATLEWLRHFKVGDKLLVRGEDDASGDVRLSFMPASTEEREERVRNLEIVAVRPDWTDNRGLLGYFNPITRRYTVTPALRLLLQAREEAEAAEREGRPPSPFFLVLDEMNLARVEQYFSDFLSGLESGEAVHLYDPAELGADEGAAEVPGELHIPANVFFTGTVNVDESTYMFSPKVLDRAFTIELHDVDLAAFGMEAPLAASTGHALALTNPIEALPPPPPLSVEEWLSFGALAGDELRSAVIKLNSVLTPFNRHFGYRVANEVARFVNLAAEHVGKDELALWGALDLALLEKVLPKLHGTLEELDEPLQQLFRFAVTGDTPMASEGGWEKLKDDWRLSNGRLTSNATPPAAEPKLPRMAAKIWKMLRRLHQQGFTSFIE